MVKHPHKYLTGDVDRHGKPRWYVRRPGKAKVRLREPYGSPAFFAEYMAALTDDRLPAVVPRNRKPAPNTLGWLVLEYFQSAAFKAFSKRTQYVRRRELEKVCETAGEELLIHITSKVIRKSLDRRA